MSKQAKPEPTAKMRFVVKERKEGRHTLYGVYDVERGGYPIALPGLGKVEQFVLDEEAAQAEADRLEAWHQGGTR